MCKYHPRIPYVDADGKEWAIRADLDEWCLDADAVRLLARQVLVASDIPDSIRAHLLPDSKSKRRPARRRGGNSHTELINSQERGLCRKARGQYRVSNFNAADFNGAGLVEVNPNCTALFLSMEKLVMRGLELGLLRLEEAPAIAQAGRTAGVRVWKHSDRVRFSSGQSVTDLEPR